MNQIQIKKEATKCDLFGSIVICYSIGGDFPRKALATKETTNKTKNTKNTIFAISADAAAMPPNPNTPAIIATTKNVSAQFNMIYFLS